MGKPAFRYEWERTVRAAKLPANTKLVALLLGTYASPNGHNVRPGLYRLSVVAGLSYRAVKYAMAELRRVGLIEVTQRGARKSQRPDTYRLYFAEDLIDRLQWRSPDEEDKEVRAAYEREEVSRGRGVPVETGSMGKGGEFLWAPGDPKPNQETTRVRATTLNQTKTPAEDVRTKVDVARERNLKLIDGFGDGAGPVQPPLLASVPTEDSEMKEKTRATIVGIGICVPCYVYKHKSTVARDPIHGSTCVHHLHEGFTDEQAKAIWEQGSTQDEEKEAG